MRYYAQYDATGILTGIGTGSGGIEITEAEYNRLLAEIRAKCAHVDAVYADPQAIDQVPQEWRDEILQRVEERKRWEAEAQNADIPAEEALDIIYGGKTT